MTFHANSTIRKLSYATPINIVLYFAIFPCWLAIIFVAITIYSLNCTFYKIVFKDDTIEITTLLTYKTYNKHDLIIYNNDSWTRFGRLNLRFDSGKRYHLYKPERLQEFEQQIGTFFPLKDIT